MLDEKERIRREAKRARDILTIDPDWADDAARVFLDFVPVVPDQIVSAYYPIGKELDPSRIVEGLWAEGVRVCLPVVAGDAQPLRFVEWTARTVFTKGEMGIQEPADGMELEPDIVLVPLLAFDQRGGRIGYGKGHYDATLHDLRGKKNILAIGLAFAEQAVLLPLPLEDHDEKLDMVVTQQRVFDFRR